VQIDLSDQLQLITPLYIQEYLRATARMEVSLVEAAALVPLVRGQKAAFAGLERFDVDMVRPSAVFDPREPYGG
jgi:hypothetical protein